MKNTTSLQKNLSVGLTLAVALLWTAAFTGAALVAQQSLNAIFDNTLRETAQRVMPLAAVDILNRANGASVQSIMSLDLQDEHLSYLVRNHSGRILIKSHNADLSIFKQPKQLGFSTSTTHRFYTAPAVQQTLFIEVAESLVHRHQVIMHTAMALLWPLLLLIPFCFAGSWFFVRYCLRHVADYRHAIEFRGSGDLSPIDASKLPTEVKTIADAVNHMLARLRRALELERNFTANSAHELRTPIATALAQIQRLQQQVSDKAIKTDIDKVEQSLRGLANLSEKLMQLAKAESGSLLSAHAHNLVSLLVFIVDEYRRLFSQRIISLAVPKTDVFMSSIDADAFAILLRNLIDNALKHGNKNQPIHISLSDDGVLSVINGCALMTPEQLTKIRQRFYRINPSTPGSGLGLAIAEILVRDIGAHMTLLSPATGRKDGFEARVEL